MDEVITQHRRNVKTFNPKLAEAVGFTRMRQGRRALFGKDPEEWEEELESIKPRSVEGLEPIGLKEIGGSCGDAKEKSFQGRVLNLCVIDVPLYFAFETADFRVTQPLSIVLLVKDEDGQIGRVFIHNYVMPSLVWEYEEWNEIAKEGDPDAKLVEEKFSVGYKLAIIDPELKTASDGMAIVVNNPENLVVTKSKDPEKNCRYCYKEGAEARCSRCHKAYYCNKECQTDDWNWRKHQLACVTQEKAGEISLKAFKDTSRRPKWTVYHLEQLCYEDVCPSLEAARLREDYGFARCGDIKKEGKLIGLYQGLIKIMRVDMVKLHQALLNNKLVEFVKECFETYGSSYKGEYYEWFLLNSDVLRKP